MSYNFPTTTCQLEVSPAFSHVFIKTEVHGKKFLDIGRHGKQATVDNTTIHSFPNITGHILYFKSKNKAIVGIGKQAQFM